MKQKFRRYQFVHVDKEGGDGVHFSIHGDFDAIVRGSYSDLYGGKDISSYSLYILRKGCVVDSMAWFQEWQLSLWDTQDQDHAAAMIEAYNLREN